MSSVHSRRVSSSEDCSSEDSNSSSSTGSSSSDSRPGQIPNPQVPDPQPINQVAGQMFTERDEPVDNEPGPYDPDNESWEEWEERLRAAGYFPLSTYFALDIPSHVSKIALNKIRRRLPDGYTLLYKHDWPNIVEPHQEDRIGFHTISLDAGTVFPLRPLLTETGCSQAETAKTFTVQPETVEIHDEDEPQDDRSKGKGKEKAGRRMKKVATTHPSYAKKRARSDSEPASRTIEEAFINLGLRLRERDRPHTAEQLGMGSPSEIARLKKEKEEMALIQKSQADELIRLSGLAGAMKTEISQLKEENGRIMDEVSEAKREMALKEENFPGRAAAWVEENKAKASRVMTASPEATMESFRLLYREPEGRKMITAIGSFGFKSGQKKDQAASHWILKKRDPDFTAASYGLAPIPEEEPTPPFLLD
ncbi:unnamed protein product [Cuscuta campestris]|uniref:Uncharacterized protein n=1 Tax=Cuscuta campestris TaxID=132261 RepID=A0A484KNM1_9ASTE|nr:unnamed protein product [Cuscuta campestris]